MSNISDACAVSQDELNNDQSAFEDDNSAAELKKQVDEVICNGGDSLSESIFQSDECRGYLNDICQMNKDNISGGVARRALRLFISAVESQVESEIEAL